MKKRFNEREIIMELTQTPIDFNELETLILVDSKAFLITLAPIFLKDANKIMAHLERAVQAKDCQGVQQAAHMLKGSCASLAMTNLATYSRELEQMAKTNELAEASAKLGVIQAEYGRIQTLLHQMMETAV